MKRFLILALLFAFSCKSSTKKGVEKPDNLIPEDKMVQVMADVHVLEAALNLRFPKSRIPQVQFPIELRNDSAAVSFADDPEANMPLQSIDIFKREGVTKKQYESSMKWYCTDPENLSKMYDDVIIELMKRQTKEKTGK